MIVTLTESKLRSMIHEAINEYRAGEWNEAMFRSDLKNYIEACREYDGSVMAANSRQHCLVAVLGSLPVNVSGSQFGRFMATNLSFGPDIENQVDYAVNWVRNKLESNQSTRMYY